MNININEARKEKIWEELLNSLKTDELEPDEKTVKMVMEEHNVSYCKAKKYLYELEKKGLLVSRKGKNNANIYKPA